MVCYIFIDYAGVKQDVEVFRSKMEGLLFYSGLRRPFIQGLDEGRLFVLGASMTFEELLKKISPTLKRITYKLNGHFTFFNDEDLYQEALVHLWLDFREGKLEDKTDSYILQGCYFHLKNYIRKTRNKADLVSLDMLVNNGEYKLEEVLFLESKAPSLEQFQKIDLSNREREVLSLCADGFTIREIGRRLGVSHVMVVKLKKKIQEKSQELKEELKVGYQR